MKEIYTDAIIALAASLQPYHPLPAPALSGKAVSTVCGSKIDVELCLDDSGRITAFTQNVKACLLGQASATLVQQHVIGLALEDIDQIAGDVEEMLRGGPVPTRTPWNSYKDFVPAQAYPERFPAVLLVFEAIRDAISKQQTGQTGNEE